MKTITLIVAVITFLVSTGCGSKVKPPLTARSDPYRSEQVHYVQGELRGRTAVGDIRVDRNEAGILLVTVPIRAAVNKTFSVDWKITFFDANGRPLSNTGWAGKTLNANTFEYITANSLTPDAKDFQMDLRYSE
jgi:hypothetical protein